MPTLPRALAGLSLGVLLAALLPAPAARAAPVCTDAEGPQDVCVTSLRAENTVPSEAGGPLTVTATLSAGSPAYDCLTVVWQGVSATTVELRPVAGTPGSYSGTRTLRPFSARPGVHAVESLTDSCGIHGNSFRIEGAEFEGSGVVQPLVVTGGAGTAAPVVRSFAVTAPAGGADVTDGPVQVPIEARITGTGVSRVVAVAEYARSPAADPRSIANVYDNPSLTLVSGTAEDGVWRGTASLTAGTLGEFRFRLSISDRYEDPTSVGHEELRAAGFTSVVPVRTTAPPRAATSPRGETRYLWFPLPGVGFQVTGFVTWQRPAGPAVTGSVVDSASAGCGRLGTPDATSIVFTGRNPASICTVTFRLLNAAGAGPATTVRFI